MWPILRIERSNVSQQQERAQQIFELALDASFPKSNTASTDVLSKALLPSRLLLGLVSNISEFDLTYQRLWLSWHKGAEGMNFGPTHIAQTCGTLKRDARKGNHAASPTRPGANMHHSSVSPLLTIFFEPENRWVPGAPETSRYRSLTLTANLSSSLEPDTVEAHQEIVLRSWKSYSPRWISEGDSPDKKSAEGLSMPASKATNLQEGVVL